MRIERRVWVCVLGDGMCPWFSNIIGFKLAICAVIFCSTMHGFNMALLLDVFLAPVFTLSAFNVSFLSNNIVTILCYLIIHLINCFNIATIFYHIVLMFRFNVPFNSKRGCKCFVTMLALKGFSLGVTWHVLITFQLVWKSFRTNSAIVSMGRGFFMFSFDVPLKFKRWCKADCTKLTIVAFGLVVARHVIITFRLSSEVFGTNPTIDKDALSGWKSFISKTSGLLIFCFWLFVLQGKLKHFYHGSIWHRLLVMFCLTRWHFQQLGLLSLGPGRSKVFGKVLNRPKIHIQGVI